jgi:hypothetical protein
MLALQRTYGNQAVLSLLAQRQSAPEAGAAAATVQRQLDEEDEPVQTQLDDEEEQPLQRVASEAEPVGEQDLGARLRAGAGGGSPLAGEVQRRLEAGLGTDLSGVRVHTDGEADRLAQSVSATAFTSGADIYFRQGAYNPGSSDGLTTLAHEATHVVQQAAGPVAGTPTGQGVSVSDPGDTFEQAADASAAQIASGAPVQRLPAAGPPLASGTGMTDPVVQRMSATTSAELAGKIHGGDSQSTTAVAQDADGDAIVYSQSSFASGAKATVRRYLRADGKAGASIYQVRLSAGTTSGKHAEMAIYHARQDEAGRYGASQKVCTRCAAFLGAKGKSYAPSGGRKTAYWWDPDEGATYSTGADRPTLDSSRVTSSLEEW